MPIEYKTFEAQVKAFDDENLILEHFISTEHKDRDGDVMRAKGMKVVGKPVVLLLHGRGSMGSEPVGKPLSITVEEFKDAVDQGKQMMVPISSNGMTSIELKDLPGYLDSHPEVKRSHWFGFVDVKECKGCGQGCEKHDPGKCETCKAQVVVFTNAAGEDIGRACEKCQPEEFARLQKEVEEKAAYPMEARMAKMEAMMSAMEARCKKMEDAMQAMTEAMKNLEPLLKTLPPDPDGGEKGDVSQGNPPGQEEIPLLVFQPADKSEEARKKEERDQAVAAVAKAIAPIFKTQIDKIMGRVP